MAKKKSTKRNLTEWAIIIGVAGLLYFTGLYTDVIGYVQQAVLMTGIIQPEMNIPPEKQINADFNLTLVSFNYDIVPLEKLKGKVIFLNFWASWCPPCRGEMPTIQNLYDKLKDENNIAFVMFSLDNDTSKAKQFIRQKGYTFPAYFPAGNFPGTYNSGTIPSTFIISPSGKIVSKEIGMADYNSSKVLNFITELAKEKISGSKTN